MNCGSRLSAPPHNGSDCAQVKFGPYSRDRDQHAFPWRATHDALSGVGEKSGGQVNQGETHLVHGCSEVPASHSVRCFMNGSENKRDCPEGGEIQPCLVGELEKLHRVTASLAPVQHKTASVTANAHSVRRVNHHVKMNPIFPSSHIRNLSGSNAGNLMNPKSVHLLFFLRASRRSLADCIRRAMFFSCGVLYQNSAASRLSATSCNSSSDTGIPVSWRSASATSS